MSILDGNILQQQRARQQALNRLITGQQLGVGLQQNPLAAAQLQLLSQQQQNPLDTLQSKARAQILGQQNVLQQVQQARARLLSHQQSMEQARTQLLGQQQQNSLTAQLLAQQGNVLQQAQQARQMQLQQAQLQQAHILGQQGQQNPLTVSGASVLSAGGLQQAQLASQFGNQANQSQLAQLLGIKQGQQQTQLTDQQPQNPLTVNQAPQLFDQQQSQNLIMPQQAELMGQGIPLTQQAALVGQPSQQLFNQQDYGSVVPGHQYQGLSQVDGPQQPLPSYHQMPPQSPVPPQQPPQQSYHHQSAYQPPRQSQGQQVQMQQPVQHAFGQSTLQSQPQEPPQGRSISRSGSSIAHPRRKSNQVQKRAGDHSNGHPGDINQLEHNYRMSQPISGYATHDDGMAGVQRYRQGSGN